MDELIRVEKPEVEKRNEYNLLKILCLYEIG